MRIKVTTPLNTRIGGPHTTFKTGTVREPGEEIEVTGTVQGEDLDGNNIWYKAGDEANSNFWSGGAEQLDKTESNNFQQWMIDLNLPDIWAKYAGTGVGVAVVDTGIAPGITDLFYNAGKYYVYDKDVEIKDNAGHGTFCAALIGLRNTSGNYIGVAPGCNLFACKISEKRTFENTGSDAHRYADAINWCAKSPDIHVISISWSSDISNNDTISLIQGAIDNAVTNNKIVVCSIGNSIAYGDTRKYYPACLKNTIGVGMIPDKENGYPCINEFLSLVTNGSQIKSYDQNNEFVADSGSSFATAITSGIIALMIQKMNFSYSFAAISEKLVAMTQKTTFSIAEDGNQPISFDLPLLKPELLLNFFNSIV
jgi:subtilisin family serine protease